MTSDAMRRAMGPGVFTAGYLLPAVIAALVMGNGEFVFYIIVMIVLIGLLGWVHMRVRFSAGLLWCMSVWGLMHMAGGLVPVPASWPIHGDVRVLYSWWLVVGHLKYDQVVHAFGFGVTTWLCWQALRAAWPNARPGFGVVSLCVLGAMGCGALNEVVEFVATLTVPNTNVGGYINTGWDLVANTAGAITVGMVIYVWGRGGGA